MLLLLIFESVSAQENWPHVAYSKDGTFKNVELPITGEMVTGLIAPMEKNFQDGCRKFVQQMYSPKIDPKLREWITEDMSSAPPKVALSAINDMAYQFITGEAARMFKDVKVPVISINGDLEPIEYEINRKHMLFFDAVVIKEAGHFLMMARPVEFNKELEKAITKLTGK